MQIPYIFDISRGSFVDGPGIRTVVFLKGCPLSCVWCHNPEAISPAQETFYSPEKCIKCGNCQTGKSCFTLAKQPIGRKIAPADLIVTILEDKAYFEASSGGVTFSGGEPCLFMDYLHAVIIELKKHHIHIILETSGFFDPDNFNTKLHPWIDLIYFDIKIINEENHKKYTGVSNHLILENLDELLSLKIPLLVRIPLVPGITATKENIKALALFFKNKGINECVFLPYNPSGINKWQAINKDKTYNIPEKPMSPTAENNWISYFRSVWEGKKYD